MLRFIPTQNRAKHPTSNNPLAQLHPAPALKNSLKNVTNKSPHSHTPRLAEPTRQERRERTGGNGNGDAHRRSNGGGLLLLLLLQLPFLPAASFQAELPPPPQPRRLPPPPRRPIPNPSTHRSPLLILHRNPSPTSIHRQHHQPAHRLPLHPPPHHQPPPQHQQKRANRGAPEGGGGGRGGGAATSRLRGAAVPPLRGAPPVARRDAGVAVEALPAVRTLLRAQLVERQGGRVRALGPPPRRPPRLLLLLPRHGLRHPRPGPAAPRRPRLPPLPPGQPQHPRTRRRRRRRRLPLHVHLRAQGDPDTVPDEPGAAADGAELRRRLRRFCQEDGLVFGQADDRRRREAENVRRNRVHRNDDPW